jgi:hypothetical protein
MVWFFNNNQQLSLIVENYYQKLLFTGFFCDMFCDSCFELAEWKNKSGFQ